MSTSTPPGRFFVIYGVRLFNKKTWRNLSNQNFEPELVQKQFILITITWTLDIKKTSCMPLYNKF